MELHQDMEQQESGKRRFFGKPAKWIASLGILISVIVLVFSAEMLVMLGRSGMAWEEMGEEKKYVETADCADAIVNEAIMIGNQISSAQVFETNGAADWNKAIDIMQFDKFQSGDTEFEGNPETSYTLKQMSELWEDNTASELGNLVDQYRYDYDNEKNYLGYYTRLSKDYLSNPEAECTSAEVEAALTKAGKGSDASAEPSQERSASEDYMEEASNGAFELTNEEIQMAQAVQDATGVSITTLSDEFIYLFTKGSKIEKLKTLGGTTLAQYAAKNYTRVSLLDSYQMLRQVTDICGNYLPSESIVESNGASMTNVRFYIKQGNIVYTNVQEWKGNSDAYGSSYDADLSVWYQRKNGVLEDYQMMGAETSAGRELKNMVDRHSILSSDETVFVGLDNTLPVNDDIYQSAKNFDKYAPWTRMVIGALVVSCLLLFCLLAVTTVQSGRKAKDKSIRLYGFDRLPSEVSFVISLICCSLAVALGTMSIDQAVSYANYVWVYLLVAVVSGICWEICLFFYYSLVRRIKGRNIWKNSLTHSIMEICRGVYAARNTSTKIILAFSFFIFSHMFLIAFMRGLGIFLCLLGDVIVLLYLIRETSGRQTVIKGLQQIGSGDLEYKVDASNLRGDTRQLAETVNLVGEGLQEAVKERMKSERLKADLITNVSHDIKTPLTSIINYVDLLKREKIEEPRIRGYIEVLDSKSQRLKHLTEDLVEASKVSSGNVKLEFMILNLNELVQQMNGEFDEKFQNKHLEMICSLTKDTLRISADSRRIWRVLENLYGNVVKYAMPGTRVYIGTYKYDGKVQFTMKNISEHPLNIDAEQLTERFIRGDVSRSTEGSGLGLSIAQNLTKLMHGGFQIYLDGDLFKVTITFDEAEEDKYKEEVVQE